MLQFLQNYGFLIFIGLIIGHNVWSMRRTKKAAEWALWVAAWEWKKWITTKIIPPLKSNN